MSDAPGPDEAVVVGGRGGHGFAVSMRHVRRIVRAGDLPPRHRRASLPRLFDDEPGAPAEARFAELADVPEGAFLEVGPEVHIRSLAPSQIEPVPAVLRRTATRWCWKALVHADGTFRILVDVPALALLLAPRGAAAEGAVPSPKAAEARG